MRQMTFKELAGACSWFWFHCACLGINVGLGMVYLVNSDWAWLCVSCIGAIVSALGVAHFNAVSSARIRAFYDAQL
jgi:hypothetical protein